MIDLLLTHRVNLLGETNKWVSFYFTGFEVEPLLLHMEWSQPRWPRHLFWMPSRHFIGEVFWSCLKGRKPRTRWLAWENLGVTPNALNEITRVRKVRTPLFRGEAVKDEWMNR